MKTAVYLDFKHNAKEVIETYKAIFNAEVVCEYLYDEDMTEAPDLIGKIFHAELKLGDLNFYLSDAGIEPSFPSMKFIVEVHDEAEAHEIFKCLGQGGKIIREFKQMSFGPTIADVEDKFGIVWNVVIC